MKIYLIAIIAASCMLPLSATAAEPAPEVVTYADTDADNDTTDDALAFAKQSRTTNSLGQRLALDNGEGRFNKQDCIEKAEVSFNLVIDPDGFDSGGNGVMLYVGSDCKTTPASPRCNVIPIEHTGRKTIAKTISELFGDDFPCSGTGSESLWLGPAEEGFDWRLIDTWSESIVIAYDMDNPDPPTLTKVGPGDEKFTAYWSEGVLASTIYILYYPFPGQSIPVDQATDEPIDTESVDDTTDDTADGGDNGDAGVLAARSMVSTPYFSTAAASPDTEPAACPSDIGDVVEGNPPDPTGNSKYNIQTGNKGAEGTVKELTNKQPYVVGLVIGDDYLNYSNISNTMCVTPGETDDFFEIYKDAGGQGGKFCFVATAAFGSYDHPSVQLLRMFRDRFLTRLPGGEQVIAAYYRVGPQAATIIEGHPVLRIVAIGVLTAAAGLSVPWSLLGPIGSLLGVLLIAGALVFRRKTRLKAVGRI